MSATPTLMMVRNRNSVGRRRGVIRRGAVMAEFAIIFPILFLAIVGIIEFGRAMMIQQILTNAAREGARRAVVPETTDQDVLDLVDNYLVATSLGAPGRSIQILDGTGSPASLADIDSHQLVSVLVTVPYNEAGFGVVSFFSGSTMGSYVTMRRE